MGFFDKTINKMIKNHMEKRLEATDGKMKEMIDNATKVSEQTQQRMDDAKKPVDHSDPKWEPIHGITLDKYAELSVYMAKNNIVVAEKVKEYVEANGVPRGMWLEVLNGWTVRIGQDVDVRIRHGVIYGDLFMK